MSPYDTPSDAASARERVEYRPPTPEEVGTAAALCWLADRNEGEVTRALGITRRTLARWKHRPEFVAAFLAARLAWEHEFRHRNAVEYERVEAARAEARARYEKALAEYGYRRRRRKPHGWWS
jgi:hypothetical protein